MKTTPYLAGTGALFLSLVARLALEAPPPRTPPRPAAVLGLGPPLDLNAASPADLEALPGVGPKLAARIVAERERRGRFSSVDELLDVPGVGPLILHRIAENVTIGAPPP